MFGVNEKTLLGGCLAFNIDPFRDSRGLFLKVFNNSFFQEKFPEFTLKEAYLTTSKKNVIRGMHFQLPPHHHSKIVICTSGSVRDVLLDLRNGDGYGDFDSVDLGFEKKFNAVYLPKGIAHGFRALSDDAELLYLVETEYSPEHDAGVLWNSFGFNWLCDNPICSKRDSSHQTFLEFSPPSEW